ncbi:DUF2505 domain-containing protein [Yimella sp. cx-51]|uniref:DUF2505 domain-containing protein n=1 Tax=Yimella sp. cx-51 TaxID=2770551 RepID=UPI00165E8C35|nr:DUF2505 domain-containing protein [Yimella sp. cx-51]MBC9956682.1 DUF2505 domain-containing protein [Yimella sp. cx-51]QTH38921.1 DUF2505 domain-containing protein [Yimella sp. cx-51]
MKIERSWTYPASVTDVYAMITDEAYQRRKAEATSTDGGTVDLAQTSDGAVITVSRVLPTDAFPENIRAMVGKTITVVETQNWGPAAADGARTADLAVDVKGTPASMNGTVTLTPSSEHETRLSVIGDLKGGIPIIGGRIEKAAAPSFVQALVLEEEVGLAYLAER